MKLFGRNVGRLDAQSRRVAAPLYLLGGIAALSVVAARVPWLVWILGIGMVALGARYIALGLKGCGTWLFGALLAVFGVLDVVLARSGAGSVALSLGIVLAAAAWLTATAGRCPINGLLGLDTRATDAAPLPGQGT